MLRTSTNNLQTLDTLDKIASGPDKYNIRRENIASVRQAVEIVKPLL